MYASLRAELDDSLGVCEALTNKLRDAGSQDAAEATVVAEHVGAQLRYLDVLCRRRAAGSESETSAWERAYHSYRSRLGLCISRLRTQATEEWSDMFPVAAAPTSSPRHPASSASSEATSRRLGFDGDGPVSSTAGTVSRKSTAESSPRADLLRGARRDRTATAAAAPGTRGGDDGAGRAELLAEVEELASELKRSTQAMFATLRDDNAALDSMAELIEHDLATGRRANEKAEALVSPSMWGSLRGTLAIIIGVVVTTIATLFALRFIDRVRVWL